MRDKRIPLLFKYNKKLYIFFNTLHSYCYFDNAGIIQSNCYDLGIDDSNYENAFHIFKALVTKQKHQGKKKIKWDEPSIFLPNLGLSLSVIF